MISFLNPIVLLGLVAASVPLIIHFLSRFRAQQREFSSLLLLREVQSRNVRKLKTRQLLLLILRTLIIALLVLAPARPVVRGLFGTGPTDHLPTAAVFILDTSASTGFVHEKGPVISFLAQRLKRIMGWMNPADRFRILSANEGFTAETDSWLSPGERPAQNVSVSENMASSYRGTSLGASLEAASRLLQSATDVSSREVYLCTDCQGGFLGPDSIYLESAFPVRYYLVEAHEREPSNVAVESVGLPGELVRPGSPLKVTVMVAHFGNQESAQVFPRLYLDNRLVGQGEAVVGPGEKESVVVEIPPLEPGIYELAAQIDADGLAADNQRAITLKVPPRVRVMLVESRRTEPDYLGSALEVLAKGPSAPIKLDRRATLPLKTSEFTGADLFIIHGVSFQASQLSTFLAEVTRRKKGLFIIPCAGEPDEQVHAGSFNSVAARFDLPLELGGVTSFGKGGFDSPEMPRTAAASGALFASVFDAIPGLEELKIFALRRLPPLQGGTAGSGQAAAGAWDLQTKGGNTLIRLVRRGSANVLVAASDLANTDECELPRTPLLVPMIHSLIMILADRGPMVNQNLRVGETATIYFGGKVNTTRMEIHGPEETRFLLQPGEYEKIEFKETDLPGIYRIYDSQEIVGAFCVGLDPREADLRFEKENIVRDRFVDNELKIISAEEGLEGSVFLSRWGVETWPALLVLVLGLLVVEQVLANRKEDED